MTNDPNDFMAEIYRRQAEVQAARKDKEDRQAALLSGSYTTPGAVIESGGAAVVPYPGVPPSHAIYARALVNAVEYMVRNDTGVAKVPLAGFGVSTLHLRNSLRAVRNYMMASPPMGFPIENLTFVSIEDGTIVRDKRRTDPYKVTAPIANPNAACPIVATPEVIAAWAVLLNAKDEAGKLIVWPDFVLAVVDEGNVQSYNDLMRQSFPSWWDVSPPSGWVEIKRKK